MNESTDWAVAMKHYTLGQYQKIGQAIPGGLVDGNIALAGLLQGVRMFDGNKPIVVCGGEAKEAKDMDVAQALAESLAHGKGADAYILKPVRKVAPKRDVVTTDLA